MFKKYMYWTLKKTTELDSFLRNLLMDNVKNVVRNADIWKNTKILFLK